MKEDGRPERFVRFEHFGRGSENYVAAAVPLGAPLDHKVLGQIEPERLHKEAQRGVD